MDLLLVEDDIDLQKVLAEYLELSGFKVYTAHHGKGGLEQFHKHHVDLCILDVMMPVMDGFTLAGEIRKLDPSMPVVFLTAKNQKEDKLRGLKIGADDYITKPFEAEELVLRLHNILKRTGKESDLNTSLGCLTVRFHDLMIDDGKNSYNITPREAELLRYLIENRNAIVTREQVLEELY
jgi:DNA-binding response OmpR family regulator